MLKIEYKIWMRKLVLSVENNQKLCITNLIIKPMSPSSSEVLINDWQCHIWGNILYVQC